MSRTRRTAYGFGADLLFQFAFLLTGFLTTPWIVRWLGAEPYGAYRTLIDWLSLLGVFEWGIGGALMASLAMSIGAGDERRVRALLRAGFRAYLRRTAWMLAGGALFVATAPYLLASSSVPTAEIRAAAAISAVTLLLTPMLLFRALAEARQLHHRVSLAMLVQTLVLNAAWLGAAWAGWGLAGQAWGLVMANACGFLLLAVGGLSQVSTAFEPEDDPSDCRSLDDSSGPVLLAGLIDRVPLASGTLTIGWLLGPAAVVSFFLTQRMTSVVIAQLKAVADSSWAGLVELQVRGEGMVMRARLLELTGAVSGLGVSVLSVLIAYNRAFIDLWVGSSFYAGDSVTVLGAIDAWLLSLHGLWIAPVFGLGQLRRWLRYGIAFVAITLLTGTLLTAHVGSPGPLLGIVIGFSSVISWASPKVLSDLVGAEPHALWTAALKPLLWGIPYSALLVWLARNHPPSGWAELAVAVTLTTALALALWWMLSLDRPARSRWRARFREII